jgi:ATP-dependent Clp protease protease subunit
MLLAGLMAAQTVALVWLLVSSARQPDALPGALADYLDARINAGIDDPALKPDDPLLRSRTILLFHDVNSYTAKDVSARLLYLNAVDPKAPITLYISTQGGWSDSAFTIIDTIRTITAPVNTWAVGGCYSSGALILAAATGQRYATDDAVLMIHTNMDDSSEAQSYERLSRERYERVFRETTKLPADWYPMTNNQERYLDPKLALEYQLVDEVVPVWTANGGRAK